MSFFKIAVRDRIHRVAVSQYEVDRNALEMILRGELEGVRRNDRIRAMIELDRLPSSSKPEKLIDRCTETGRYRVGFVFAGDRDLGFRRPTAKFC